MGICFEKSIFAMVGTIGDEIVKLAEHLNVQAEDGEKYGVIHERLLDACPKLHTKEQLKELAEEFVLDFIEEFNHRELYVWFNCNAPLTFGDEMLIRKYHNLLKIHDAWVGKWVREHNIILRVDAFLFGNEVREAYHKHSGICFDGSKFSDTQEWVLQLWGLVKTIHDSFYDSDLVSALQNSIKSLLHITGGEYYTTLDLTDKEVLRELYYVLCEVNHTSDGFKGHDMWHYYNGYGGTVFETTGEVIEEW